MLKFSAFLVLLILQFINLNQAKEEIIVYTVASEETDGYKRFIRSANHYGIQVKTLGMGEKWQGGDMNSLGGGYKVNLLKKAIAELDEDQSKHSIILFTDSYDVIFTTPLDDILRKFKSFNSNIVFGAEKYLWPKQSLEKLYPTVSLNAAKYLNSGLYIGYKKQIEALLNDSPIENSDDDQLYFSEIFVNESKRKSYGIKLDTKSEIFQNLNGAKKDIKLNLDAETGSGSVENLHFKTFPSIIHGNGASKYTHLRFLGNYLAGTFDKICKICKEDNIELDEENLPTISLTISIIKPYPFLKEFWEKIGDLNYPKNKINLFVHCHVPTYVASDEVSKKFIEDHGSEYLSVRFIGTSDELQHGKQVAVDQAIERGSDYLFFVDGDMHLDNPNVLRDLLKYNRGFIAPLLSKHNSLWSNFWGDLSTTGFYARSLDYMDIVDRKIIGMWNVPYISGGYLIKKELFPKLNFNHQTDLDPDMSLCEKLRKDDVFMYIVNEDKYGHLVDDSEFDPTRTKPDFYSLPTNQLDWEKRYLHPEYHTQLNESYKQMQPCTDVFWLKMVTDEFCDDLVEIMETFGQWSSGSNKDDRIQGGYENVPTRDIHFRQVGLNGMWNKFMNLYIKPLSELIFTGYSAGIHFADLQFVVRYKPDEQPFLRPHHDASTYTINIALNRAGIDYEGGGCKFTRYNCSVTDTKKGWMLMHPGRLTHQHEGLYTTKGTRYILVTFINP